MTIKHIRIKNYRSLSDINLRTENLNILVGCNDEGKSNLLRALDLFFNGQSGGKDFNWNYDFSGFAKNSKGKAKEIEITLTIKLPPSYSLKEEIKWKKIWKEEGFLYEEIKIAKNKNLPPKSKAFSYLKSIRFEYIPAIKSNDYFERLLASIYQMLDSTVKKSISKAAEDFAIEIKNHTDRILYDLNRILGYESDIELPNDLRKLFSELEFKSNIGSKKVALDQRGDGIKVRHIPIILKWLANQANHLSAPGKPRVTTIWGYEEPENNLEIKRCFELADFFIKNSSDIQTFITTHSPVFYTTFETEKNSNVIINEVSLNRESGSKITPVDQLRDGSFRSLNSSIGFLDLLEPHVKKWRTQVEILKNDITFATNKKTIFVEGPSDKIIIDSIIKKYYPEFQKTIQICCSKQNGGGHSWVKDSLVAWHHLRAAEKSVGLFDADKASKPSIDEFSELVEKRNNGKTKALKHIINKEGIAKIIKMKHINIEYAIEEICPIEAWKWAKEQSKLEKRKNLTQTYNFNEEDITFNEWLKSKLGSEDLVIIAKEKVKETEKISFAKYIAKSIESSTNQNWDWYPLKKLTEDLLKKLDLNPSNSF